MSDLVRPAKWKFPAFQEGGLVVVLAVMWIALSIYGQATARQGFPNRFLDPANLVEGMAKPMSLDAIMAMGMTCVIITGGIDISVASTLALSGLLTARTIETFPPDTAWYIVGPISLFMPIAIGLLCGLINGGLIIALRLHPFIVTLGTLSIFRCLCNFKVWLPYTDYPSPGHVLPKASLTHLFANEFHGLQVWPMVAMFLVIAVGWFYLRQTVSGREHYAVGGNEEAARFSGIRVGRSKLKVYAISGALAGLAGLVSLGRFGSMSAQSAAGEELTVVAAAVVGGASLMGGRGTALGALLGTLVLATIDNTIEVMVLPSEYKMGIVGIAIIAAAAIDQLSEAVRKRRLAGVAKG